MYCIMNIQYGEREREKEIIMKRVNFLTDEENKESKKCKRFKS
jgi:hypothetical protein